MITQEKLKELVRYDPVTGYLHWRKTRGGAHAGKRLGELHKGAKSKTAYYRVEIFGVKYFVHNLVWLYHTGELPWKELDHADRDGLNNRFENLRKATSSENKANSPMYSNNTSGITGVYLQNGKWRAEINRSGKKHHIGIFTTFNAAVAARQAHEQRLFKEFSPCH